MLQCTSAAASTLESIRSDNDIPEDFGVRVYAARTSEGEVRLGIDFAPEATEGDEVSEQHGTTLIVAREISDQLDEMVLDVSSDPTWDGEGPHQFVLRPSEGA